MCGTAGRLSASHNHEDGGLGMLDACTVLSCMKMGWMRRLMSEGSGFGDTVFKRFPDLNTLKLLGGKRSKRIKDSKEGLFIMT